MFKGTCTCPPHIKKPPACTIPDCPCSYRGPPPLPFQNLFDDQLKDQIQLRQQRKSTEALFVSYNNLMQKTERQKLKLAEMMEARRNRFATMEKNIMKYINNKQEFLKMLHQLQNDDDTEEVEEIRRTQAMMAEEFEEMSKKIRNVERMLVGEENMRREVDYRRKQTEVTSVTIKFEYEDEEEEVGNSGAKVRKRERRRKK